MALRLRVCLLGLQRSTAVAAEGQLAAIAADSFLLLLLTELASQTLSPNAIDWLSACQVFVALKRFFNFFLNSINSNNSLSSHRSRCSRKK